MINLHLELKNPFNLHIGGHPCKNISIYMTFLFLLGDEERMMINLIRIRRQLEM